MPPAGWVRVTYDVGALEARLESAVQRLHVLSHVDAGLAGRELRSQSKGGVSPLAREGERIHVLLEVGVHELGLGLELDAVRQHEHALEKSSVVALEAEDGLVDFAGVLAWVARGVVEHAGHFETGAFGVGDGPFARENSLGADGELEVEVDPVDHVVVLEHHDIFCDFFKIVRGAVLEIAYSLLFPRFICISICSCASNTGPSFSNNLSSSSTSYYASHSTFFCDDVFLVARGIKDTPNSFEVSEVAFMAD
jgi:hypothetical protein